MKIYYVEFGKKRSARFFSANWFLDEKMARFFYDTLPAADGYKSSNDCLVCVNNNNEITKCKLN